MPYRATLPVRSKRGAVQMPNALDDLKGLLDEVYSGDAVEEEVRDKIDEIIGDANTLVNSIKGGSL